jgi:predicted amidohydrolase
MSDLRIIGVEAPIVWESPEENRKALEVLIRDVVFNNIDIVVLPENFTSGFSMNIDRVDCWEDGLTLAWMKELSSVLDVALFGSVAFKMPDGTARNRGLFVKPSGEVGVYDKKNLFTLGGEDKHYVGGKERTVVEFRGWKILLQICYDLRFPVFSKNRTEDLYDAIIYVANWPKPRIHAWRTLLQARAIENQCYVMGVNRLGEDPSGNIYTGDSLGVDPLGGVLSEGPVVDLKCERGLLDEFRRKCPFLCDG